MHIILATGIYPPDIGGPATYVQRLARELVQHGHEVTVISFGSAMVEGEGSENGFRVIRVARRGGPILRWNTYAKVLKKEGKEADIVYCFSSVSTGIPLLLSNLKKPRRILRLGGDFLWERYTAVGGKRSLRAFYKRYRGAKFVLRWLLRRFHYLVFSTDFQMRLFERHYRPLPARSVIENAQPEGSPQLHQRHEPLRALFLGRFVGFKNLPRLLKAASLLPHIQLTLVGEGPMEKKMHQIIAKLSLGGRATIRPSVHGEEKQKLLAEQDLLVLPSLTEISPNAALEARAVGMPVLLTEETGLSSGLTEGMIVRPLRTAADITRAVLEVEQRYEAIAEMAAQPLPHTRSWEHVVSEHLLLFEELLKRTRS